ncbi:MAG: Rne/Rng family ribonuclease [Propionibacteriales bacterium]|nr:Rne/Rng family ribonuclease [Propionibacteriales bacterium]
MLDPESTQTPDLSDEISKPETDETTNEPTTEAASAADKPAKKSGTRKTAAKKATAKKAASADRAPAAADGEAASDSPPEDSGGRSGRMPSPAAAPLFQPPEPVEAPPRKRTSKKTVAASSDADESPSDETDAKTADQDDTPEEDGNDDEGGGRRRRRRGGRRRRKSSGQESEDADAQASSGSEESADDRGASTGDDEKSEEGTTGTRRRRRRRRQGEQADTAPDDPENTVVRVRERRATSDDEISGISGSIRLEAKKQRRREGREAGRRRPPIVSEAEFLARRESVDRVMVIRERENLTQIGVLEDGVLVEHYVARESQTSLIGNVYLGRVQNVLPSMEAAFIDIGKGRNAVLYAGEVNWDLHGVEGQPRRIETALQSGQTILVQATKDPVSHKGARLTSQITLPGRYLVYVPGGQTSGISRKLPDTERNRLKTLLKEILPDDAGVIIRTAAEGASEEELRRDVTRLTARWEDIEQKVKGGQAPQLLYGEPDLLIKVVRDLFTEDFNKLVVAGDNAWDMIEGYVGYVAPDLMDRVERWDGDGDVFAAHRLDEQIEKGLERKVFLPSGGSLVIDRTEAMTVIDVNTGKFTGSGGSLEETVTKNNLEAAEELVRQLRLRDIGGIIVIDFIDMVLESNRDLVLRRLIECLGRDRTRHQVAEVTSLGLVQMTRKRIGTGLLEAFSEPCEACKGRGLIMHHDPVEPAKASDDDRRGRRGRRRAKNGSETSKKTSSKAEASGDQKKTSGDQKKKAKDTEPAAAADASTPAEGAARAEEAGQAASESSSPAGTSEATRSPEPEPAVQPAAEADPAAESGAEPEAAEAEHRPVRRTRRRAAVRPAGPAGAPVSVQTHESESSF